MKNKVTRFLAKQWALIWVFVALAVLGGIISYAAYTKANKGKSVVATYDEAGDRFSSNYMNIGSPSENYQSAYAINNQTAPTASISICNYAQGNPGYYYDRDIEYRLTIELVKYDGTAVSAAEIGDKNITVSFGTNSYTFDNEHLSIGSDWNGKLLRGQSSTDICSITFDVKQIAELDDDTKTKLYIQMTATPYPASSYRDLHSISMRMGVDKRHDEAKADWEGYFNDVANAKTATSAAPIALGSKDLDGFNYAIEGIGKGQIELKYNSNKIEINQAFVSEVSGTLSSADAEGIRTLTFSVNSNDTKTGETITAYGISRYDTQFYKTSKTVSDYETWYQINGYITSFKFTEDAS